MLGEKVAEWLRTVNRLVQHCGDEYGELALRLSLRHQGLCSAGGGHHDPPVRLIQFGGQEAPSVGRVKDHDTLDGLDVSDGVYALVQTVMTTEENYQEHADALSVRERVSYEQLVRERALLPPVRIRILPTAA